jgi:hypothetical protein
MDPAIEAGETPSAATWGLGRRITFTMLNVYAFRMGAVFVISTATIGLRTRTIPRWLAWSGNVVALVLLLGVGFSGWVSLLLPAWVFVLSVNILLTRLRAGPDAEVEAGEPGTDAPTA